MTAPSRMSDSATNTTSAPTASPRRSSAPTDSSSTPSAARGNPVITTSTLTVETVLNSVSVNAVAKGFTLVSKGTLPHLISNRIDCFVLHFKTEREIFFAMHFLEGFN